MTKTRVPTGPFKFDDDWTGVFIRGDEALNYARVLQQILPRELLTEASVTGGLIRLLESCRET